LFNKNIGWWFLWRNLVNQVKMEFFFSNISLLFFKLQSFEIVLFSVFCYEELESSRQEAFKLWYKCFVKEAGFFICDAFCCCKVYSKIYCKYNWTHAIRKGLCLIFFFFLILIFVILFRTILIGVVGQQGNQKEVYIDKLTFVSEVFIQNFW